MTTRLEPLNLRITGNSRGLSTELARAKGQTREFSRSVEEEGRKINAQFGAIRSAIALAVPAGAFAGAGFGLRLAAEAEQADVAFRVLLGSATEAKDLLQELTEFSAATPFQLPEIRDAARQLVAFGFSSADVGKELEILGNLSAGTGNSIKELADLIGRFRVQETLYTQDINQLTGRGIDVLGPLADRFGVVTTEIRKLASEGKIQFSDLQAVLEQLALGSGRFAGLMLDQARTLNGSWSTFKDNVGLLAKDFGNLLLPVARDTVQAATELLASIRAIDVETAQAAASWAAFGVSFSLTVALFPRLIALGAQLIATVRALATSITIAQALSGPKGWASLAAGLAFAAGSLVAVDSLFAGFNATQAETQQTADDSAESFAKLSKEIDAAAEALGAAATNQEQWVKTAENFRKQFETPVERYARKLEELRDAVRLGGLDFDIFARGVAAAADELQGAAAAADQFSRPEFVNPDSAEFIRAQFERDRGTTGVVDDGEADRTRAVTDEVEALRAELDQTRADALNESLEQAKKRAGEIAEELRNLSQPVPVETTTVDGLEESRRFRQSDSFTERAAILARAVGGLFVGDFTPGFDPEAATAAREAVDARNRAAQEKQAKAIEQVAGLMQKNNELIERLTNQLDEDGRALPPPLEL